MSAAGLQLVSSGFAAASPGQVVKTAQVPGVSVTLAALVNGVPATVPLFGGNNILEYQLTVHDAGPDPTGAITITDSTPRDALYQPGTATCGSVPGCSVNAALNAVRITHEATITYVINSVAANSSEVVSFEVKPRQGAVHQDIHGRAHWTGSGCESKVCRTNDVVVGVTPRPVQLFSLPINQATVQTAEAIDYTMQVRNVTKVPQTDVVVTDPIPSGTAYVNGSATCGGASGCTVSASGSTLRYTMASVAPRGKAIDLAFSVTVTASSGSVTNVASWTGDLCVTASAPCATNTTKLLVVPGSGVTVTKTSSPSTNIDHGGTITYTFVVSNSSAFPSGDIVITDGIPTGTTFVANSGSCGAIVACSDHETNGSEVFNITNVAPFTIGETVRFQVKVNSSATGTISNTAIWMGPACVTSSGCPTNTLSLIIGPTAPATVSVTSPSGSGSGTSPSTSSSHSGSSSSGSPGPATSASHGSLATTGLGRGVTLLLDVGGGLLAIGAVATILGLELSRRRGFTRSWRRSYR